MQPLLQQDQKVESSPDVGTHGTHFLVNPVDACTPNARCVFAKKGAFATPHPRPLEAGYTLVGDLGSS